MLPASQNTTSFKPFQITTQQNLWIPAKAGFLTFISFNTPKSVSCDRQLYVDTATLKHGNHDFQTKSPTVRSQDYDWATPSEVLGKLAVGVMFGKGADARLQRCKPGVTWRAAAGAALFIC